MSPEPAAPAAYAATTDARTTPHGLDEGIALALQAEDRGDWKPVANWLANHPEHGGAFAEFLAAQRGLRSATASLRATSPELAGANIGGFELREELGRGGAGVVYRAFDPKLNRDVAVKLVRTGEATPTELARFRFEAKVVAALDHPNIVPVLSFDEDGAIPYLVMPLMTGGSLAKRLKSLGPDRLLPPREAVEIVRDIALGVHHAHQRGLIHRDLKPGNILLDRDNEPHVADFGLARPLDVTVSLSGSIAGTFEYMAPEQARGDAVLTVAVDVHALGVILFELLTGRTPFGAKDGPSVLRRVIDEPAPSVRGLRPDVPRDLETICMRCLKKLPSERYSSAHALAEALTKYLKGEPIDDRRGWVWNTVSRALGWHRETIGMSTWRVAFWGGASTTLAMAILQAAVLLDAPLWVSQAAIAYYLLAWLGLMWFFFVMRRDSLNPVERASTALNFGAKFGCVAILPVVLWFHDGNPLYALPPFLVVVSVVIFAHGIVYWGRYYLVGLAGMALTACMPLVPPRYWPAIYGLFLSAVQVVGGFHLRRIHQRAALTRQIGSIPDAS